MLLIDSGNSAIKCRLLQQGQALDRRFALGDIAAFGDYLGSIDTDRIIIACVSGAEIYRHIEHLSRVHLPLADSIQLKSLARLNGLANGYRDHSQLGVDRWLTMVAVIPLQHRDVMIVDAGSAITIDLVSRSRGHLGGAILPGLNTSLGRFRSVFSGLQLEHKSTVKIQRPGRDTLSCIDQSEAPYSVAGVISILQSWQGFLQSPVEILLTGQDAEHIAEPLQLPHRIVPDLVFAGMLKQIELLG